MSELPSHTRIASDDLSAEISSHGAELTTLKDANGLDLQWNGDPAVWTGRAPILFPIVGMLKDETYRLGDQSYHLPKHGFARRKAFAVIQAEPAETLFRLEEDEETLKAYPFAFQLDVGFKIVGPTLTMTSVVRNTGDQRMPASFGYHPAFCRPLPYGQARPEHKLTFDVPEPSPIRRINTDGLLLPDGSPTPVSDRTLILDDALFEADALIFDQFESQTLCYGAGGGPSLEIGFPKTSLLGVWAKVGGNFVAIEPWHGIADPVGYDGDFFDKPGVFTLSPGAAETFIMTVTWKP